MTVIIIQQQHHESTTAESTTSETESTTTAESTDGHATGTHTTDEYTTSTYATDGEATGSTTSLETLTSTVTATNVYTITSCAPTVTNCPYGSVTTAIVTSTTTWCPGEESKPTKAPETLTSTITTSTVYTITSCAPTVTRDYPWVPTKAIFYTLTVTNCPYGSLTIEVVTAYTTYCPGEETKPKPTKTPVTTLTSTYTSTRTYTVTDCPGKGSCTKGALTTEAYTSTTLVCPQTTGTYTLHQTVKCAYGMDDCSAGSTKTVNHVVTIYPVTEHPVPTPVPGCSECVPPPVKNATATYKPTYHATDKVPSYTAPSYEPTETISVVTGAGAWNAPGLVAVAMGVLLAAAI
ncbi:hypothetical protein G7Z17_g871 [Cylindrodendrum hubeiense]|uniref:Uncharacterized protein n=1 Tax=Cylindrodendrum hubeiense TaxID=595255 RepID=A0A9P5HGZ4_9HYPO|nr:hypothetical protein G7Z17_g871 [Cylindrodendrum hubeiense]